MLRRAQWVVLSSAIVVFWAVMVGFLLRREVLVPALPAGSGDLATALAEPRESWMGVFMPGGRRVGYVHTRSAPKTADEIAGAETTMQALLRLPLMGEATSIRLSGRAWTAFDGRNARFNFAVRSGPHDLSLDGHVAGGYLDAQVHTAGEDIPIRIPVHGNPLFSGGLGTMLSLPALEPGQEFMTSTFDPMTLSMVPVRLAYDGQEPVKVGEETYDATVVRMTTSGVPVRVWLTSEGEVLRAETTYGFTLVRVTAEEATRDLSTEDGAPADMLAALAVQPKGKRPFRGAREMRFRVDGLEPAMDLPVDALQQKVAEREYRISTPEEPRISGRQVVPTHGWDAFFASDALIQVNHPEIQAKAHEIVGEAVDPWQRAMALYEWVYTNIEKKNVLSVPSALDVLKTRQGDCNEHTVLYTALARAAGIPTRIAIGVVWSEELNGFYYHAWPEIYMEGWIPMDPTLGQPIADATHVKLLNGDLAEWARIMPFLGRLQLDIADIR